MDDRAPEIQRARSALAAGQAVAAALEQEELGDPRAAVGRPIVLYFAVGTVLLGLVELVDRIAGHLRDRRDDLPGEPSPGERDGAGLLATAAFPLSFPILMAGALLGLAAVAAPRALGLAIRLVRPLLGWLVAQVDRIAAALAVALGWSRQLIAWLRGALASAVRQVRGSVAAVRAWMR